MNHDALMGLERWYMTLAAQEIPSSFQCSQLRRLQLSLRKHKRDWMARVVPSGPAAQVLRVSCAAPLSLKDFRTRLDTKTPDHGMTEQKLRRAVVWLRDGGMLAEVGEEITASGSRKLYTLTTLGEYALQELWGAA